MDGISVCTAVRAFSDVPILMLTAHIDEADRLLASVHDGQHEISDRAIETHIKNLRKKVQVIDPGSDCISSVYGVGYRFDIPD